MIEEIKRLASESLEEKWYKITDDSPFDEWISGCAFCEDARYRSNDSEHMCNACYIAKMKICGNVEVCEHINDKTLIVKALEELVEYGELTIETRLELATD